jgi:hypothetical protein
MTTRMEREQAAPISVGRRGLTLSSSCATIFFLGAVLMSAQQQPAPSGVPALSPSSGRPPTGGSPIALPGRQTGTQIIDYPSVRRQKQIADDTAALLQLATDLKTEVDKTTKDTLSIPVIRKADQIEKLAHALKDKTKVAEVN